MQNNGDDKNKSPKKSLWKRFWKAWCEWWRLTFESYWVEVQDRILMSWKRIYKFAGITIIPILYGVICSVAIWNPVEEIGRAQTIVMDNDYSMLLVSDSGKTNNTNGDPYIFGAVKSFNNDDTNWSNTSDSDKKQILLENYFKNTGLKADDISFDPILGTIGIRNSALKNEVERNKISAIIFDNVTENNNAAGNATFHLASGSQANETDVAVDYNPSDAGFSFSLATTWDVIRGALLPKADKDVNTADSKYKFQSPVIVKQENVALKNIKYSSDVKWNNDHWTKNAGYMQVKIPGWYTSKLINYGSILMQERAWKAQNSNSDNKETDPYAGMLDEIVKTIEPLNMWTTFERNFLYGYLFNVLSGMMGSQVVAALPSIFNTAMISNLSDYLSIDGATLLSLNGALNKIDDPSIATLGKFGELSASNRYDISDYSGLNANDDTKSMRLKNSTIFGDVNAGTINAVGGKFINTIKTLEELQKSGELDDLLGIIEGPDLSKGITKLVDAINKLINTIKGIIGGDKSNATYDDQKGLVTYELDGVSIKGETDADSLQKDFVVTDQNGKTLTAADNKLSYKYEGNKLTVTFAAPAKIASATQYTYKITPDSSKAEVYWPEQIIFTIPAASNSAKSFAYQPVQLDDSNKGTTISDDALVQLNKAVYTLATGGKIDENSQEWKIIQSIWKTMFGKELPDVNSLQGIALFKNSDGTVSKILDSREFGKRSDLFISKNSDLFSGATSLNDVMPAILASKTAKDLFGLKTSDVFTYKVQGAEFGIEGIGLGIFFLTVGLFVGCILLSFIFDRAKRLTKAKWSNWYISKWLLMLTVAFFQVTAEVWVVYAAGWHMIGPTAMCYVWLWLLFVDIIFVTIVQALWFSMKDEIIGKFLCVLVLVTSIAAGGGEFPAISEFKFFHAISYIVPFTYTIRGFDEIAFGISLQGTQGWSTEFMFQQFGIGLIYIAVFMAFGILVGARFRMREMDYGSHYGFAVAGAMRALGRDTSNFQVLRKVTKKGKKKYYYNWHSLPKEFDPELYFQCREMYKFAGEFKWWQRKHHDFVQKPNYSDEEIITRNE